MNQGRGMGGGFWTQSLDPLEHISTHIMGGKGREEWKYVEMM